MTDLGDLSSTIGPHSSDEYQKQVTPTIHVTCHSDRVQEITDFTNFCGKYNFDIKVYGTSCYQYFEMVFYALPIRFIDDDKKRVFESLMELIDRDQAWEKTIKKKF